MSIEMLASKNMPHIGAFTPKTTDTVCYSPLALLPPLQMMEWLASEMAAADNPWLPEKEKHVVNVMCGMAQGIQITDQQPSQQTSQSSIKVK